MEKAKIERQLDQNLVIDAEVRDCIAHKAPWDCFASLMTLDIIRSVSSGLSRTERYAALVPAERVFLFCSLDNKSSCANSLVRHGYSISDVEPLLARYYDRPTAKKIDLRE
jgi:hypothetical protein